MMKGISHVKTNPKKRCAPGSHDIDDACAPARPPVGQLAFQRPHKRK
jgi:hypothetical protein